MPLLKGICGSTATTFKKTHVVIWTSPFLKAGLFASTLLLSKVFHVCMRLTSCATLFKSMLYVLASVNELNLQLKVLALSSAKRYTCLYFPGQLTTFLIWSKRHILIHVWQKKIYVWNTYSSFIRTLAIRKFRQLWYREWELCYIHVGSPRIFSMVTTDNCWHVWGV